jgi:hypothetical protein
MMLFFWLIIASSISQCCIDALLIIQWYWEILRPRRQKQHFPAQASPVGVVGITCWLEWLASALLGTNS